MKVIKKIAVKGIILIVALIVLNFIYKVTLWKSDMEEYSGVYQKIENAKNADILYLGDCSDSYFGKENEGEKGIGQLLDSLLLDKNVETISEIGFHAGMYYSILNQVPDESKIKTVIVTMNLRSFSELIMNNYTSNSINQRLIILDNNYPVLLNRFFLSFRKAKLYTGDEYIAMRIKGWKENKITLQSTQYKTLYAWKQAFENGECANYNKNWNELMKEKGLAFITNYGFQINPKENLRISDFDKIVSLSNKRNWQLIFHLLPENIQESKELVGEYLIELIKYNRQN